MVSLSVSISAYWSEWLNKIVASRCRKSRAEIVEEGLKAVKATLDNDAEELKMARKQVREEKKWKEAEAIE